jgi:hypothetical protein
MAKKSKIGKLSFRDVVKGLYTSIITGLLTGAYQAISTGGDINVQTVKTTALVGAGAGVSYLVKNVLTNSEDQFLTGEKPQAIHQ